ncbi:uncharacterized protein LOC117539329 [Gymnodraco acuticeps]|uniref:Uncharacterized protein LOC117539329 n=1 Tax=Gymnodraco acuticeps TaxID=8218 RepID=A0A6P8U169_GYMAC|nr:uncharacterized protein LOC117539329 [Gymnodraco acuticeps]
MSQIKGLEVLNDCNENKKMLAKLPDWLTSSWNRKVTEMEEQNHTFPTFSQFVKFLTREAKIACNPITSLHALKSRESKKGKILTNRSPVSNVLTTETNETADATNCLFCEKTGHGLHKCYKFRNETISEQVKFVQENKLCFGCLKSGHRSERCAKHAKRDIQLVSTTIAPEKKECQQTMMVQEKAQWNVHEVKRHAHHMRQHPIQSSRMLKSPIHPQSFQCGCQPQVSHIGKYLCMHSSIHRVTQALSLKKRQRLASRNTVVSCRKLTGLQVRGIYSDRIIPLPVTYSREFIPANRDHIPTPETAKAWPHLEHLADEIAPQQSCDVGLLIGYNCSQALVPREVVPGEGNQPFAQRTDLGWSVVGFGNPCLDIGDMIGVSHQVTVKQVIQSLQSSNLPREGHYVCRTQIKEVSPADVVEVLESDFVERASEDNPAD